MICPLVLIICSDCWIFGLLICVPLSLFHSPRHNSRRLSLFMRVVSHSDTHHLNRHMVGCGCHEILIQPCITVVLLPNFSLYPIRLSFWWLSDSIHWFQLISIQCSVHHSDSARNHQSCNQKTFISTTNGRQAHFQRYIFCWDLNIACELIASAVYKIYWFSRSKALAVPERSQKYLPNNSKWRA